MIKTAIANEIWNLKYRNENETEDEFYLRILNGLFKDDKYLNDYARIVGLGTAEEFLELGLRILREHFFLPAGRATYALGTYKQLQTLSNCFVLPIRHDSMDAIMECAHNSAMTMKAGGGTGYNFCILRPAHALIKSSLGSSSGIISFMKIFNTLCDTIKAGNNRRGAQMGINAIWHPDIEEFITCKRDGSLQNFNLSVYITDEFMEAVENDSDWDLIFPDTAHPQYNDCWDGNIKKWKSFGFPIKVYKTLKARDLFNKIIKSNYDFAEPGLLFEDTINKYNNLWYCEYILATNPCVTGDTLVETHEYGKIRMDLLVEKIKNGETINALTYNINSKQLELEEIVWGEKTRINADIIEIETDDGKILKLTPDHQVFTENRGYVKASQLTEEDILISF